MKHDPAFFTRQWRLGTLASALPVTFSAALSAALSAAVSAAVPAALVLTAALLARPALADDYTDTNTLLKSGKYSEALNKADLYLATKPRDPQMRFIKGVVLTEMGRPADALTVFQTLTQDYPEIPEPYNNLAALYAQQNQFDKARAALEMAVRINPNYAIAHENLGDVYARLAGQSYARALQLDNTNAQLPVKLNTVRGIFNQPKVAQPAASSGDAPAAAARQRRK